MHIPGHVMAGDPALMDPNFTGAPVQQRPPQPALAGATGNARGSMRQPALQMPNQRIGLGEAMIRMAGAGDAAASQGGLASMGAMSDAYGSIMDYNRAREMEAYKMQQEMAAEEQRRKDALAARMARSAGKAKGPLAPPSAAYSEAALNAIEAIEQNLADETWNPFTQNTGFFGNLFEAIPGTPAHDTAASIETIVAAIGFDRLQAMRDASPTGGALGQVSEMELRQLNASLGSLRQSSSREQFSENLAAVKRHYVAAVRAIKEQQAEYARMNGLPVPSSTANNSTSIDADVDALLDQYAPTN